MSHFLLDQSTGGFLNLEHSITDMYDLICAMSDENQIQFREEISVVDKVEHIIKEIKKINDKAIFEYHDSNAAYVKKPIKKSIISIESEEISVIEGCKQPLILEQKNCIPLKTLYKLPDFYSFYDFKSKDSIPSMDDLNRKDVFGSLDLYADLRNRSFRFLLQRYVNNLVPTNNYRVTVRFIQVNNPYITPEFVITCAQKMGLNATNINGNVVIEIKKLI